MTTEVAATKRALYFGYVKGSGHFLCDQQGICWRGVTGFPWTPELLDTGLLRNGKVRDMPNGRVYWTGGGAPLWLAFYWWDRSGDKRANSSSGFYVQGFSHLDRQAALDYACEQWPDVVARQHFPLVLQS